MKTPLPFLLTLTGVLSFACGVGVTGWLRKPLPTAVTGPATAPGPPASLAASGDAALIDPAQIKTDARALVASPQAFLASLRELSPLKARGRIVAAIADLPLAEVRNMARHLRSMAFGNNVSEWTLVSSVCERWAELDVEGLFTAAQEGTLGQAGTYSGVEAAFRELARHDPEAAWRRTQDMAGYHSHNAKQSVLSTLGQSDPARALALAQTDGVSRRESWMVSSFMQGWLGRDPQAALQAFEALPVGELRSSLASDLMSTYAAIDPEAALAWSQGLRNPTERQQALHQVLRQMADTDPQRVLTMAEQPEFAAQRRGALDAAIRAWARQDFDAAFAHAMASKNPGDQQAMLQGLNQSATAAQREKLLEIAASLPPGTARSIYQSALTGWGANQGNAREIIERITSPSVREEVLKSVINNNWSLSNDEALSLFSRLQPTSQTTDQAASLAGRLGWTDPEDAMKWAESLDSADLRTSAVTAALRSWAGNDPTAAAQKAGALADPTQREEALRTVAGAWGPRDERAALAWAETLTGKDRTAAMGALVQAALRTSPEQAQQLYARYATGLDAESAQSSASKQVARSLAATLTETDPRQALAWAQGLAEGAAQQEAWAGIAEKWAGYDARATSEWISTLPAGEGRDLAAERLVSTIARDDPDSAWAWALSIGDRAKRREAASRTLDAWKAYGAKDTAREALGAAGFSDDELKELSKRLE